MWLMECDFCEKFKLTELAGQSSSFPPISIKEIFIRLDNSLIFSDLLLLYKGKVDAKGKDGLCRFISSDVSSSFVCAMEIEENLHKSAQLVTRDCRKEFLSLVG